MGDNAVVVRAPDRLLNASPLDHLPTPDLAALVDLAESASLVGRGGAGFPTAIKLRSVAGATGLTVVGNAMEGEPLSSKDAVLLERSPHLVVEGLTIVAAALGARRRVIGAGSHISTRALTPVAAAHGVEVVVVQGGFVAGQESALSRGLSGMPAVPADPSVRISVRGVRAKPTLVLNVETLAQVALVARHGTTAAMTSLYTLSGAVTAPGVVEAPRGSVLRDVLRRAHPESIQAVLLGGYHGTWLPSSALDVRLTPDELDPWGAKVGAGVIHVLSDDTCPIRATAQIATYLAREVAGQCGPCINALPRVADTLERLAGGHADARLVSEVARLSALATGRGACAHPDGTVRMVLSAMRVFDQHVAEHLDGECRR